MDQSEPQSEFNDPFEAHPAPELVIGLVAPLGIDLDDIITVIGEELGRVGYATTTIRLSSLLREVSGREQPIVEKPEAERIASYMSAGTELRTKTEIGGILARLAVAAIQQERNKLTGSVQVPAPNRAYILRSLKHGDEIRDLRDVYGDGFITISAYAPKTERQMALEKLLARSNPGLQLDDLRTKATQLIERDESEEGKDLGQNVGGAFPLADLFLDASQRVSLRTSVRRFIEVFFGNTFLTPTREEFGMFQASSVALRSADLSRQVGAALATPDGEIIALGCNDTPRAGGGVYWSNDEPDGRDFSLFGFDPSEQAKREIIAEVVEKLSEGKVLSERVEHQDLGEVTDRLINNELKEAKITSLLEFGRVLHAEMAAITDASRRGTSTKGTTLFCTTFPCHLCARLIIAAGISKVVFVEPYPKSKTYDLYYDSVSVDGASQGSRKVQFQAFVGIAPRRYDMLFRMNTKRKVSGGQVRKWIAENASPRLRRHQAGYIIVESNVTAAIPAWLEPAGFSLDTPQS